MLAGVDLLAFDPPPRDDREAFQRDLDAIRRDVEQVGEDLRIAMGLSVRR